MPHSQLTHDARHPASFGERAPPPLLCFSHLRWDYVYQRPQHLMSRFAARGPVLFWQEPEIVSGLPAPRLELNVCPDTGVRVTTPRLRAEDDRAGDVEALRALLDAAVAGFDQPPVRWYYTPMMLPFSRHIAAAGVVYDCMDELAAFRNTPPELLGLERELFAEADLVFTGGYSLYEAKRDRHADIHPFPSSVDRPHFAAARRPGPDWDAQEHLPCPRFGYYGAIDERIDLSLVAHLADARPDWTIVLVGPVVKIALDEVPRRANIHHVGCASYDELPSVLRGWDVALMPFARNDATRYISPTKTPEYLAAGKPVVSTPIADVVRHYGALEGVRIADTPEAFVAGCDAALALALARGGGTWRDEVDRALAPLSWDATFAGMAALIDDAVRAAPVPVAEQRAA